MKPSPAILASPRATQVDVPAALFLTQLPANEPGKTVEDDQVEAVVWETPMDFQALVVTIWGLNQ